MHYCVSQVSQIHTCPSTEKPVKVKTMFSSRLHGSVSPFTSIFISAGSREKSDKGETGEGRGGEERGGGGEEGRKGK